MQKNKEHRKAHQGHWNRQNIGWRLKKHISKTSERLKEDEFNGGPAEGSQQHREKGQQNGLLDKKRSEQRKASLSTNGAGKTVREQN